MSGNVVNPKSTEVIHSTGFLKADPANAKNARIDEGPSLWDLKEGFRKTDFRKELLGRTLPKEEEAVIEAAFRAYDKNKDLYVTEEEFISHILSEYMANGKKLPEGVDNISDYITKITDKFRRNAGSDGRANIDEFKNMYAPEAHSTETEHTDVYPL